MLKEFFTMSVRNLNKRKLRTGLTMLGIFISVATIFMLVSLSLGLQGAVEEQFETLGADKFFIQPSTGFLGPPGSVGGVILTEDDVDVVSKVRGVKDYSFFTAGNGEVEFSDTTRFTLVWGIDPENQDVWIASGQFETLEGRFLDKNSRNSVVLGNLHKTGGLWDRPIRVGNKITINEVDFKVRGIMERVGNPDDDRIVLIDITSFRELYNEPEKVDFIFAQVEEGEDTIGVAERTEEKLRKSRGLTEDTQDFDILTPDELLESFGNILNIVTGFLAGVAAISLIVGAIGISNTMYTSVLERTKEIGLMKAIGAQNKDILIIFLVESGVLGLIGAAIGVGLGFGVSKLIEFIAINQLGTNLLQAAAPSYLILGCLAFGLLIGAVSGALPAYRASKTNVVDALRYE